MATTIRYWAAAKEAAGVSEEALDAVTLSEALAAATERRADDPRFVSVLARSSFLIDGAPVGTRAPELVAVTDGAIIEVLPPFAGG